ncbi:hypothetical protein EDD92_0285 [Streptomyces sp. TLI_185]|nr:hypothetical protein EDD92_0285 [Streptomyces sp. TLI_185]
MGPPSDRPRAWSSAAGRRRRSTTDADTPSSACAGHARSASAAHRRRPATDGGHRLKGQQVAAEKAVADRVDAADTDQPRSAPHHPGRGWRPEPVASQALELRAAFHQPRQIEQALVDDTRVDTPLDEYDWRSVLVETERVDVPTLERPAPMPYTLARQRTPSSVHVGLDQALHIRLGLSKTLRDLGHTVTCRVGQLQARHLHSSTLPTLRPVHGPSASSSLIGPAW